MGLFEKKVTVFRKKDKAACKLARAALTEAGLRGVKSGSFENEAPACGCGSKLDPRDFGPNGKVDRLVYYVDVPAALADEARQILTDAGIEVYRGA